jgi:hypothetical protein
MVNFFPFFFHGRVQGKQWQLDVHFIIAGSVDGR